MSSRKKTPCEFCEEEQWWTDDGPNGHQLSIEVYPFNNVISISSFAHDELGESHELEASLEMNFCPDCGRKLD